MSRDHVYTLDDGTRTVVRIDIEEPELREIIKAVLAPDIPDYMEYDERAEALLREYLLGELPHHNDPKSPFYNGAWFQVQQSGTAIAAAKKASHYEQEFEWFPDWTPHGHRTPETTDYPQDRYAVAVVYPRPLVQDAGTVLYGVCYFNSGYSPYDHAESLQHASERMDPRTLKLVAEAGGDTHGATEVPEGTAPRRPQANPRIVAQARRNFMSDRHRAHQGYGANWYRTLMGLGADLPRWEGPDPAPADPFTTADARGQEKLWSGWKPFADELERIGA